MIFFLIFWKYIICFFDHFVDIKNYFVVKQKTIFFLFSRLNRNSIANFFFRLFDDVFQRLSFSKTIFILKRNFENIFNKVIDHAFVVNITSNLMTTICLSINNRDKTTWNAFNFFNSFSLFFEFSIRCKRNRTFDTIYFFLDLWRNFKFMMNKYYDTRIKRKFNLFVFVDVNVICVKILIVTT